MTTARKDDKRALILTLIFFTLSIITASVSETTFDFGDSITHYFISNLAFQEPTLFLHHWGKPFFILFSAPFAAMGFMAMKVFQCIVAAATALIIYGIAKSFGMKFPYLAIILLYFIPDYFLAQFSGLTEPFFGLVLTTSIYLYIRDKYLLSSVLLSFLPFVRSEGLVVMIVFAIYMLIDGRWKYMPLLLTGFVAYSIIGFVVFDDILWVVRQNPYRGAAEIYGSGPLYHFVQYFTSVIGVPVAILTLLGMLIAAIHFFKKYKSRIFLNKAFLVYGCALAYFVAHSIFWWQGIFGSLGLTRVLIGIAPLIVLIAVDGISGLTIPLRDKFSRVLALGFMIWVIVYPFTENKAINFQTDLSLTPDQELMNNAGEWYLQSEYYGKKTLYSHPHYGIALKKNPFDSTGSGHVDRIRFGNLPDSTLIFWDSWFAGTERGVSQQEILDRGFEHIKTFEIPYYNDTIRHYVYAKD